MERVIDACLEREIPTISFWALSDDNIRERSDAEVSYLFDLLIRGIDDLIKQSNKRSTRLYFVGNRSLLRSDCVEAIERAELATQKNIKMQCVFAIGYGGQEEIARAVCDLAKT